MKILEWIEKHRPGEVVEFSDRIKIAHFNGECSTLWLSEGRKPKGGLGALGDLYLDYDGIDLFSSTFKIGSSLSGKSLNGVEIVFPLSQLQTELEQSGGELPEPTVAFMYQAGIGIYSVSNDGERIYEWDTELNELTGVYADIFTIFEEWVNALEE